MDDPSKQAGIAGPKGMDERVLIPEQLWQYRYGFRSQKESEHVTLAKLSELTVSGRIRRLTPVRMAGELDYRYAQDYPELVAIIEAESAKSQSLTKISTGGVLVAILVQSVSAVLIKKYPDSPITRIYIAAIFGGICGALVGLVPYFIGKRKGRQFLAKFALGSCIVSGLIGGLLLAVPVALGFLVALVFGNRAVNQDNYRTHLRGL